MRFLLRLCGLRKGDLCPGDGQPALNALELFQNRSVWVLKVNALV